MKIKTTMNNLINLGKAINAKRVALDNMYNEINILIKEELRENAVLMAMITFKYIEEILGGDGRSTPFSRDVLEITFKENVSEEDKSLIKEYLSLRPISRGYFHKYIN